jgi:hypothetical protein
MAFRDQFFYNNYIPSGLLFRRYSAISDKGVEMISASSVEVNNAADKRFLEGR